MKKNVVKLLMQGVVFIAVLGLFAGLLAYLNSGKGTETEEVMTWQPQTAEGYSDAWETVAENDRLSLSFQPSTTQLIVTDKRSGAEWRSNPQDAASDSVAFGQNKTLVQSLLNVDYVNEQSNSYTMNSFQGSVQKSTYTYAYQENGVEVNWMFGDAGLEIPCYFGIEGDHFVARVLTDGIVQHGGFTVSRISLLPYFGAGSVEDEGYMLVPDGSGALIHYNNQKQTYQPYAQTVYGRDLALNLQSTVLVTQDATMPVFGIKRNDDALLAVITQGEYQSEIHAEVARKFTSNNAVYSSSVLIQSENNTLLGGSSNEEVVVMMSPQQRPADGYEVTYYFLDQGAGYSEMAARYRQYLMEEKGMQQQSVAQTDLNLTFIGGVRVRKTMLGVPYHTVEPLTPFQDLKDAVLGLKDAEGSFQVSMVKMEKGGNESKLPTKVTFEGALGGQSGYQKMAAALSDAGIPFYPIYDPVTMQSSGNGYSTLKAARNVSRSTSPQYTYLLTSGARDSGISPDYLISPSYAPEITSKLLASAKKKQITSFGLTGITKKMYSDFRKDSVSRDQTGSYWESALSAAAESADQLLCAGAYAYAFPYADVITDVPISSSQFDVEDEAVPFYQMVAGGCASLYSTPLNLSGNLRENILRAVEYGVSPSFLLMTADAQTLLDTDLNNYYSVAYDDWESQIRSILSELQQLDGVLGQRITGHRAASDQVYVTTYDGGTEVYVNYSDDPAEIDGLTVPAMGFARKGVN